MRVLNFARENENEVIVVENTMPSVEDVLLSLDDDCRRVKPISDNSEWFAPISDNESRGITLRQLAASADIVNKNNELAHGVNAYTLIQEVNRVANECGYTTTIRDLFVADNRNKTCNGIEVNKQLCEQYREATKTANIPFAATTFNRVYAVITLNDLRSDTHIASIAISRTQMGTSVAIGANCTMCRNLCVFGVENEVHTYGKGSIPKELLIESVRRMIRNYDFQRDRAIIEAMKKININESEIFMLLGQLTALRVATDSHIKAVKSKFGVEYFPLNNTQINRLVEGILLAHEKQGIVTLYDLYQVCTAISKPTNLAYENIIPQTREIFTFLDSNFELVASLG